MSLRGFNMFYAPTHFSYIEAIVLKEDYPKYPFIFITAYLLSHVHQVRILQGVILQNRKTGRISHSTGNRQDCK